MVASVIAGFLIGATAHFVLSVIAFSLLHVAIAFPADLILPSSAGGAVGTGLLLGAIAAVFRR